MAYLRYKNLDDIGAVFSLSQMKILEYLTLEHLCEHIKRVIVIK